VKVWSFTADRSDSSRVSAFCEIVVKSAVKVTSRVSKGGARTERRGGVIIERGKITRQAATLKNQSRCL
jgi:hypothetical protein